MKFGKYWKTEIEKLPEKLQNCTLHYKKWKKMQNFTIESLLSEQQDLKTPQHLKFSEINYRLSFFHSPL